LSEISKEVRDAPSVTTERGTVVNALFLKVEDLEHWQAGGAQIILGQHGKTAPVEKQMREVGTATCDGRNAVCVEDAAGQDELF
jgi:hypothetical protein